MQHGFLKLITAMELHNRQTAVLIQAHAGGLHLDFYSIVDPLRMIVLYPERESRVETVDPCLGGV